MKIRRHILIIALFTLVLASGLLLTSCSFFNGDTTGTAPTITKVSMLKTDIDYLTSKEYIFNKDKDSETPMPLNSGGSFLISIEYENPSNFAISYVKVNNVKIMAANFEDGSSKTNTIVKITVSETKTTLEESYEVNSIFYIDSTSSATTKIAFNTAYKMTFNVVVAPSYSLTLDYQNADRRVATATISLSASKQTVKYGAELSTYSVVDKDYSKTVGLPVKAGGWLFEGYYTEPNGGGDLVSSKDTYYFWGDIRLYAYYIRIYTYEIVSLKDIIGEDTIVYNYTKDGVSLSKTFYSGVVITGVTTKQNSNIKVSGFTELELGDTLVDEVVKINENTGDATVTAIEYPIVKVGNKAFNDCNTIISLTIGSYIQEIGYYAFNNCNALEQVTFDDDCALKYIGDFAFQSTTLMGISYPFALPDNVEYLGNFAFRYSGWKNTVNNGNNESILHIYPQYKFIGTGCFFNTNFTEVIFEPGCHYESQIDLDAADLLEKADGWKTIDTTKNQIGANIFGRCTQLIRVYIESSEENDVLTPALNIIPDRAFDAGNYSVAYLEILSLGEGITDIGEQAFNYQQELINIVIPASVKEIGKKAFYNNIGVTSLTFYEDETNSVVDSQLTTLHSECFGNMTSISRVEITSNVLTRYGNGPFAGCSNLKGIEFPNIEDVTQVPRGFDEMENPDEVYAYHTYSDLLYGTFENGTLVDDGVTRTTYSVSTRIFCKKAVIATFKDNILDGKTLKAGSVSSGTRAYQDTVYVYDIGLIFRDYIVSATETTDIALQEIYNVSGVTIGYSLAYWSARSEVINIPASLSLTIDGNIINCDITEIGMYSIPTSAVSVTVPASVTRLEHDAFSNCIYLSEVNFINRNTLQYIGENAFFGTVITSFVGGSALTAIAQYAFWKCTALKWVDLSACTGIKNAEQGRKELKKQYKYDYELAAIIDGDTENEDAIDYVDSLHYGVFKGCSALTWIYLPSSLVRISTSTFLGCYLLSTVIIPTTEVSDIISTVDNDGLCFYEKSSPYSIYERTAPLTIYANKISIHKDILFYNNNRYVVFDINNIPAK